MPLHPRLVGVIFLAALTIRSASRSPGSLKWIYPLHHKVGSSPTIGLEGTIYVGTHAGELHAIRADTGRARWIDRLSGPIVSTAAVGKDGSIDVCSQDGVLWSLDPRDGKVRWTVELGGATNPQVSPAIGPDGTVYVAALRAVHAIEPIRGHILWTCPINDVVTSSPAVARDGTVYVGGRRLYRIDGHGGQMKLRFKPMGGQLEAGPVIGADGTIYAGWSTNPYDERDPASEALYALYPEGMFKWGFWLRTGFTQSPVLGVDGTIFVSGPASFAPGLFALDASHGYVQWVHQAGTGLTGPAIAADGTIYVADTRLLAVDGATGRLKWTCETPGSGWFHQPPSIGPSGVVYVASDLRLYAVEGTGHGLAGSAWPKFRADMHSRGSVLSP